MSLALGMNRVGQIEAPCSPALAGQGIFEM